MSAVTTELRRGQTVYAIVGTQIKAVTVEDVKFHRVYCVKGGSYYQPNYNVALVRSTWKAAHDRALEIATSRLHTAQANLNKLLAMRTPVALASSPAGESK